MITLGLQNRFQSLLWDNTGDNSYLKLNYFFFSMGWKSNKRSKKAFFCTLKLET